ncbi:hypothetical protein GQ53DRAFT_743413 [Thozetella sp. PMI_491]|nr:hypothetical protein GQ53DRAFT_743413 [Thozetella sp. PMI_491]
MFLTLDDHFTGVLYASTLIVARPQKLKRGVQNDDSIWMTPGAALDTPEMKGAQDSLLAGLAHVQKTNEGSVNYAVVQIFMGATKVTCKFNTVTSEPTIKLVISEAGDKFKESNENLRRQALQAPEDWRGTFQSISFGTVVHRRTLDHPGSTVWDEGEFPFSIDGAPYARPTRLLVARSFEKMSEDIDATVFQLVGEVTDYISTPVRLLRNLTPEKDPGGIVSVTVLLAVDPDVIWPEYDVYMETPAFKAAEAAVLEHVKRLHKRGKVQRCAVFVAMGADQKMYKFVGDKIIEPVNDEEHASESLTASVKQQYTNLDGFGVQLEEQPKHELFDSESHFQAFKHRFLEKAQQNPDVYARMAPHVSIMAATHMLTINFPGCDVSDEGEFPATLRDGSEIKIADTRLLVVRDPKQEPKSIVAVTHVVPRPIAQLSGWLDTPEMKAADEVLLKLLQKYHKEAKVSEKDCMAQVMMGTDATIYQFVDGERFEDYSDERMAQLKWG